MSLKQWLSGVAMALVTGVGFAPMAAAQSYTRVQTIQRASGSGDFEAVAVDGTTAIVGASAERVNNLTRAGAAYVYIKSGSTWVQQARLAPAVALASQNFGRSVAVSGDTAVVGALAPSGTIENVYVYVRSGTTWTEQAILTLNRSAAEQYGRRIAISGDTIAVSAALEGGGATYVYTRTGTTWGQPVRLAGSSWSVGLSADVLCVGDRGAATIYGRSGATWVVRQMLDIPVPNSTNVFVESCAVDGDTLAFGAPTSAFANSGYAFVFTRPSAAGTWALQQRLEPSTTPAYSRLGSSIDILGDEIAVGARGGTLSTFDMAYAFRRSGNTWSQVQRFGFNINGTSYGESVAVTATEILMTATNATVEVYARAATPAAPGAPTNVQASVAGSNLTLTWGAPASGGVPTGYTLLARTAPGSAPIVTVPLGAVTTFAAAAPNGTYVLSLTASNAVGTGPESAAITVTVPGGAAAPPGPPTGFAATAAGTTATFSWTAPSSGGAPTSYVLLAGVTPGFATPIATLPVAVSPTSFSVPGVPVGTYYVRLVAQNAGGTSAPSNEATLTVAGAPAPGAPTMNAPSVSGSTVTLSWTPGGGGAPTSYVLTALAGGAVVANAPLTGTSASFTNVPSGTYQVRIVAVNGAGSSPSSNTVTLVVP